MIAGKVALGLGSSNPARCRSGISNQGSRIVRFARPLNSLPRPLRLRKSATILTFRVKLQLDANRLRQFEPFVKVGIPGMGYVRFDRNAPWPPMLQVKAVNPASSGSHHRQFRRREQFRPVRILPMDRSDGICGPANASLLKSLSARIGSQPERGQSALRQGRSTRSASTWTFPATR